MIFEKQNELIFLVNKKLFSLGYECIEIDWLPIDRILRLYIDKLDSEDSSPVQLRDCINVNNLIKEWDALDEAIQGSYNLEVSSPGVERPLRLLKHFNKNIGVNINVKLIKEVDGKKQGKGKLVGITEEGVVSVETATGLWIFPLCCLKKANIIYNWS
ncbi:MAG: hypothetical protein HQK54_12085 [Oligoflexales bacterium]|nr:hypothetical protein [Oligoflexales bacterium]